jgi:hypothetical protein
MWISRTDCARKRHSWDLRGRASVLSAFSGANVLVFAATCAAQKTIRWSCLSSANGVPMVLPHDLGQRRIQDVLRCARITLETRSRTRHAVQFLTRYLDRACVYHCANLSPNLWYCLIYPSVRRSRPISGGSPKVDLHTGLDHPCALLLYLYLFQVCEQRLLTALGRPRLFVAGILGFAVVRTIRAAGNHEAGSDGSRRSSKHTRVCRLSFLQFLYFCTAL